MGRAISIRRGGERRIDEMCVAGEGERFERRNLSQRWSLGRRAHAEAMIKVKSIETGRLDCTTTPNA